MNIVPRAALLAGHGADATRTLRVLHSVGHLYRGGIETWLYQMVRRLGAPGWEHHVLVWAEEDEAFTAEFRDAGVTVHALPGHRNPMRFARRFHRVIAEAGPFDVLHTHGTQYHGFVMALARLHGMRVRIAHSHTDIRPVLRGSNLVYRAYATSGHAVIRALATAGRGVSEEAAVSMFGARWRDDPRWQLLYCGVDLEPFARPPTPELRASLGIPPGRLVVGHVGRFERQKNHGFFRPFLQAGLDRGLDLHLLLIGDGSHRASVLADLRAAGLGDRLTALADCRDVPCVMADVMDVFVLPSLYEGLPLVLVEAQAAGLPCLLSDSITAESVVDPATVRRLPLSDPPAVWAAALATLPPRVPATDPTLRANFGESDFNVAHSAAALAQLYEESIR